MTPFDSDLATAVFILLVGFLLIAAMCDLVSYTIPDTLSIVIAGLFAIPIVNLLAPIIGAAFMMHIFKGLPDRAGLRR